MIVRVGCPAPTPIEERFWKYVPDRNPGTCWEWAGYKDKDGYGRIRWDAQSASIDGAHRISWRMMYGAPPRGMVVCHRCDNPSCVNPNHLFLGTHADNMADRDRKGRGNAPKGARNGKAILSEADVVAIRKLLAKGETQRAVATRYGVHQTTIQNIRSGKHWSWLG